MEESQENPEENAENNPQPASPSTPDTPPQENPLEFSSRIDLKNLRQAVEKIKDELGKVIVGQHDMVEMLIVTILANGHSLIEGVPGVAKTITAKLLAKTLAVDFSRIQFTPDLMPSDILGT